MNLPALCAYAFIAAYTPGPNNIMAMTNSIRHGFSKTLVFCLGILCGFLVDMTLCALGTSVLYEYLPTVEPVMRWVGAAYIAYLAVVVFRDKGDDESESGAMTPNGFATGVVMQLVNIKVILYGITAFSTFIVPHHRSLAAMALSVLGLSVFGCSGTVAWAAFGSLFRRFHARHRRAINAIMALLLMYCAVGIVW